MKTPALRHLMGAYFHQDFFVSYGGVWETLEQFTRDAPEEAELLPREIGLVLDTHATEAEVEAFLNELGCEYLVQPDDGGYRGWLTEIARRIRAAAGQP